MSVPFHIFNQGSLVPNAVTGVSVSVDNTLDKVKASWTAPTTGRYPYGFKVMFSNATTSGGTYSLFEATTSGPAQTTIFTAATTPSFSNWYSVGIFSSNIENRLSPVTNGAAVQFGLAAKAATLGTIQTLTDGSIDVNWTSNVSLAQPTQGLRVLFTTGAGYYDFTDLIALNGTNYNTGPSGNASGLVQLAFNTTYTISILTSNTINTSFTPSTTSTATFGAVAFAAGGITNAATQSDGSITVSWTAYSGTVARPNGDTYIGVNGGQTSGLGASAATYNTGTAGNGSSIPQLTFNTTYAFSILTSNALNGATPTSASAGSAKFGTVPIAPTISSTSTGIGSLTVNLNAPSVTTAQPRTGYTYSLSGQASVSANSASTSYTFTGLAGGSYNVSVVAYNDIGNSSAATSTGITVISVSPPTIGSVRINPSRTVTVNFSGGTGVNTYRLYLAGTLIVTNIASTSTTATFSADSYSTLTEISLIMRSVTSGGTESSDSNTAKYKFYPPANGGTAYSTDVPAGTLTVGMAGGGGGGGNASASGGSGGFIQASQTITAMTIYLVIGQGGGGTGPGGVGGSGGGIPGGAVGGGYHAGGGGGYSIVTNLANNAIDTGFTLIAGAGGGGGYVSGGGYCDVTGSGGNGGSDNADNGANCACGDVGARPNGGAGGGQTSSGSQSQLTGSSGNDSQGSASGGSGGGGYWGGAGGDSKNKNDPYQEYQFPMMSVTINRYNHAGAGGGGGSSYRSTGFTSINNSKGTGGAGGGEYANGSSGFVFLSYF